MKQRVAARPIAWREDDTLTELDRRTLAELETLYGPRRTPAPVAAAAPTAARPPRRRRRSRPRALALIALLAALGMLVVDSPYAPVLFAWADQQVSDLVRAASASPIGAFLRQLTER